MTPSQAAIEAVVGLAWEDIKRKAPSLARAWEIQNGRSPIPQAAEIIVASEELEATTARALTFDGLIGAIGPLVAGTLQAITGVIIAG